MKTAASSGPAAARIAAALPPITLAQISAITTTESSGSTDWARATARGARRFSHTPSTTGSTTTWNVLRNSPHASTCTSVPASHEVSSGVIKTAAKVEHIVITTERQTLAPAR